jgi:hypothetical protein
MRLKDLQVLLLLALLSGCTGLSATDVVFDTVEEVAADMITDQEGDLPVGLDGFVEVGPDAVEIDLGEPDGWQDLGVDMGVGCEPGEGCFLDECDENSDCQAGWCVDHMGEGVCSQSCQDECPPGWECQQVAGTDPDIVYICVSKVANLCRPCATGAECKSVGGVENVCVAYGDNGSFCGAGCAQDDECPWGFSCIEAKTVDGIATKQCLADAGDCPCTDLSVELALWTPCEVANGWGTCSGKRVCTVAGLTDCDAVVPASEVCNGADDDCDDAVDEETCDDDNECTGDVCNGADGCDHVALDAGECKDGNPCTVADHCEAGICVGDPVLCDDKNPCTEDLCTEQGGCEHPSVIGMCDDGDPCTLGDLCAEDGNCTGTPIDCQCQHDADCQVLEDGDLCNGTLICDTEALPTKCVIDADTVVLCPQPQGADAPCLDAVCTAETGQCSMVPADDGAPCANGDLCTLGDSCLDGVCTAGSPANCNDGNPCTDDSCQLAMGCVHAFNQASCSDGSVCTVADLCFGGDCIPGQPLACDDANTCTIDTCDPDVGCQHTAGDGACDDGNPCTAGESCKQGQCQASALTDCNDDNPCTTDSCNPVNGCKHALNQAPCSDGDPCTINDVCVVGECQGIDVDCEDNNPCTADGCDEEQGCIHWAMDNEPCDDGNECTVGNYCDGSECVPLSLMDCDDDNVCTDDLCDPAVGCTHTFNTVPCYDEDICTITDKCNLGVCVGSGLMPCTDGNPCTDDSCSPGAGCEFVPNDEVCDDGNECTDGDYCTQGICHAGGTSDCDDGNVCTDDSCNPATGCVHVNNVESCDDNDACSINDVCQAGSCVSGGDRDCADSNLCTNDACAPESGCVYSYNSEPCDDLDPCTMTDACSGGACVGTGEPDCDDSIACTADSCLTGVGCQHEVMVDYQTDPDNCGDCGVECADDEECNAGECKVINPWVGAGATWNSAGKNYARYTWSQAGVSNNGRANAMSYCTSNGGLLARPNSQDEWDKIHQNLPADSKGYWMDGHNNSTCGSATPGNPKTYQYGMMYCPAGTSKMYTGCDCSANEQGLVAYRYTGGGPFDGCQSKASSGELGVMDENLNYGHGGIHGFICEK